LKFVLYKVSGYEEAIMSLRMSKGKFFSIEKAKEIQELVSLVTNDQGFICDKSEYMINILHYNSGTNPKISGDYETDVNEFKRLLTLTFDNSMHKFNHHTLMKYIDISFFTKGLHRGAQDDLDAHAIAFNNRITRFSTRLAEISEQKLSEWYQDKVIPFSDFKWVDGDRLLDTMPSEIEIKGEMYDLTPFGYVHNKYSQVPAKNGLAKDVQRGLMTLGTPSDAIWKTDLFNLRYVYKMRSKLTKASPELKEGMEMLADQIEQNVPIFGEYFRKQFTDSGIWEHQNKIKTISSDEYQEFKKWKKELK
jgi:thymidylate synthase ThyX